MLDGTNRPEIYPIGSTPKGRQGKGEAKLEISCQSSLICKHRSNDNSELEFTFTRRFKSVTRQIKVMSLHKQNIFI